MKIDQLPHPPPPNRVEPSSSKGKASSVSSATNASSSASTAGLEPMHTGAQQDIDYTRVAELRQAISEGRLHIDTGRIADQLIASMHDLIGN